MWKNGVVIVSVRYLFFCFIGSGNVWLFWGGIGCGLFSDDCIGCRVYLWCDSF